MLEVVGPHRPMAFVRELALALRRHGLDVAGGVRERDVKDLPAAELQAVTEIEVLAEHEVARVEEADPVERRLTEHQARSRARVHLVHVRLRRDPDARRAFPIARTLFYPTVCLSSL